MKPFHLIVALLCAGASFAHAESLSPVLKDGDVLVITGDSITQQKSYSVLIEMYLLMCQPADLKQVVQLGWSGEQASGLLQRVDGELYPFHPTVVTTSYGMNDGHYQPFSAETGNSYRTAMNGLIESFRKNGVRDVVVGSPGCVDSYYFRKFDNNAPFDPALPAMYNETLKQLAIIAKDVAQKQHLRFADVHTVMMDVMKKMKAAHGEKFPFVNNGDGVHPGYEGQLCMAYAYLKGLGCDGNIGTITLDMATGDAHATPGQKIISAKGGTIVLETTRFPFCFPQAEAPPLLEFLPFNQDLNRYMLVVKGLSGSGAKVTWGETTKQFSAKELAHGINLAAEFIKNPLGEAFGQINGALQRQQEQDRELYQTYLHNLKAVPAGMASAFAAAAEKGMEWDRSLFAVSKACVMPARHTVKIEALP